MSPSTSLFSVCRCAKFESSAAYVLAMIAVMLCAPAANGGDDAYDIHIPELKSNGAKVNHRLSLVDGFPGSRLTHVYNDNVIIMEVEEDVGTRNVLRALPAYATDFFRWFEDGFDYLLLLSNGSGRETAVSFGHFGMYIPVMNDTEGIGVPKFYRNGYGSAGRLRGVIHFPYITAMRNGPTLHELLHAWANFALPTTDPSHWGFSSAGGQLGGFDIANLRDLGEGRWTAGGFGTIANGGNGVPYSLIELYFAGLLPSEEVPDLWIAEDGEWLVEDGSPVTTDAGDPVFTAKNVKICSITDIIAAYGERNPPMAERNNQRAAAILLIDEDHWPSGEDLERLSEIAAWFGKQGEDESSRYNYYEATGGRGSLTLDGLSGLRKSDAAAPADLPASYGRPPHPRKESMDGLCSPEVSEQGL